MSGSIRSRLFGGMIFLLPIIITIFLVLWIYARFNELLVAPVRWVLQSVWVQTWLGPAVPWWYEQVMAPVIAVSLLVGAFYTAGLFVRTRIRNYVENIFHSLPVVAVIYKAVRNVFVSFDQSTMGADQFKRVVLIEFPHPGVKCPAFVTRSIEDAVTGKRILCVYCPTTPVPTSGYMLMVPEDMVVEIEWDLNETLQAVVSGGISAPDRVHYYRTEKLNRPTTPARTSAGPVDGQATAHKAEETS